MRVHGAGANDAIGPEHGEKTLAVDHFSRVIHEVRKQLEFKLREYDGCS
jgi:hypothetical protein